MLRSVTLSSDRHQVIAKLDLVEVEGEGAVLVDYKHGRPMSTDEGLAAWASDRSTVRVGGRDGMLPELCSEAGDAFSVYAAKGVADRNGTG